MCRALKVAALGTLANMVTLDANKAACSRLRAVPRLVALLSQQASPAVSTNAIAAIALLVRNDANRLKSWRCGAVEKLKSHVSGGVPHVSAVAAEAIQVLNSPASVTQHFPPACLTSCQSRDLVFLDQKWARRYCISAHAACEKRSKAAPLALASFFCRTSALVHWIPSEN